MARMCSNKVTVGDKAGLVTITYPKGFATRLGTIPGLPKESQKSLRF